MKKPRSSVKTRIKFPNRRGAEPFTILARFSTSSDWPTSLVRDYVKAWTRVNSTWIRLWRSNEIREERIAFYAEFVKEPRIEDGPGKLSFSIVFEVRPKATRWKDFAVFLVGDILKVFPEVKLERWDSES